MYLESGQIIVLLIGKQFKEQNIIVHLTRKSNMFLENSKKICYAEKFYYCIAEYDFHIFRNK